MLLIYLKGDKEYKKYLPRSTEIEAYRTGLKMLEDNPDIEDMKLYKEVADIQPLPRYKKGWNKNLS